MKDGFIKAAAASPEIRVADVGYNADKIIECVKEAEEKGVKVLTLPELCLTGCSCRDLLGHRVILDSAKEALLKIVRATSGTDMLIFVGLPFAVGARVYSCAAAVYDGDLLALIPEENPDSPLFQVPGNEPVELEIGEYSSFLSKNALFECSALPGLTVAAEVGCDRDAIVPPSARHAKAGATLIVQLAGFPETVSSTDDAVLSTRAQSRRLRCGMLMAAPGRGESTTDNVYSGLCLVAENGEILDSDENGSLMAVSEIDVQHLINIRRADGNFDCSGDEHYFVVWGGMPCETELTRTYSRLPHLPEKAEDVPAYCRRVLDMQVSGLVKRMSQTGLDHCVVGISGGVDSTLAVMISAMAVKRLGLPAENVVACTMPCFGTSSRTKSNAVVVAEQVGAEVRVIDIGNAVNQHFDDIGHARDDYSVAFENAQARERTQVLLDIANKVNGLDVGTEDLSEYVDGWCTFNGDHTSNYDVNVGLTKTQVRANVRYIAQTTEDEVLAKALWDVLDCPVTPELLPIHDDQIEQKSEDSVGSYSLQDFFTHKMLVCGFSPAKTFRLAKLAYGDDYSDEELIRWLKSYCRRLFSQQFKRSCLMDGPAIDDFSVSPRNGMLIPSDAECTVFLEDIEKLES
ncbi:MAG: NAD(+) synthase [Candidatus Limivicinus sp.]|jgi:NAD+ synthase (glutamine-hydrolysing)